MDPVTLIVTALALGAAAGLKDTASQTIKDTYSGIRTLILRKYGDVGLDALEKKPGSTAKKDSLAEDLVEAGAGQDEELIRQAQTLIQLVQQFAPSTAAEINVKLEDIKALGSVRISDLIVTGTSAKIEVDLQKTKAEGDVEVAGLRASGEESPKKS